MTDATGGIEAALRRVTLERDGARYMVEALKERCRRLRQQLRREQAAHLATHKRLDALRQMLTENNRGL